MIAFPKAKINIGLRVLRKRSDGYHDIQSLMYPIPLCDILEIIPSDEMGYDFGVLDFLGTPEDNLVVKAYQAIKEIYPNLPPIQIILRKNIPTGAGLGGGSSDATNMLLLLKQQFNLEISLEKLNTISTKLGADCPFFLHNAPQIAEGIGELLTPYPLNLNGKCLTLLTSDIQIHTGRAYAKITPCETEGNLAELLSQPISTWKGRVVNDFEPTVFEDYPILAEGIEMLYESGAEYASMSGSGPTLYGISNAPLSIDWSGKVYSLEL